MSINISNLYEAGVDFIPYFTINEDQLPSTPSTVEIRLIPEPLPTPAPSTHLNVPITRSKARKAEQAANSTALLTELASESKPSPALPSRNVSITRSKVEKAVSFVISSAVGSAPLTMAPKKPTAAASSSATSKPTANTASKRNPPAKVAPVASNTATRKSGRPSKASAALATSKVTKAKKAPAAASKKASAAKKAPAKTTTKAATIAKASASRKRKADETEEEGQEEAPRTAKRARTPKVKAPKAKVVINQAPTEKLNVYVFGEGSAGELGLGTAKTAIDVKRPRLNPLLPAADVGVVQVSCGGMHVIALTHDNKILTWGVNDDGALGRDTSWSGGLREADKEDEDSDDEDSGLNPKEATPTAIPSTSFPEGTVFTQVAASDSCSFAVTNDGLVYGWGTFRNTEGILGFSSEEKLQRTPALLEELTNIKSVACGSNSAFAIDINGKAYCWGANPQSQLGYRSIERHQATSIVPTPLRMGRTKIRYIACGNDHSFAIDDKDQVWGWGLNGHGQTGTHIQRDGANANVVRIPTKVPSLTRPNDKVIQIAGGGFHTIAVTQSGSCLTFGRCDNNQMGIDPSTLNEDDVAVNDSGNRAAQLVPLPVPNLTGTRFAAAGTDHSIAINGNGEAFSWGFSSNYQTGQGHVDDVLAPTKLENTAVRGKKITWAGCGGQYSIIAGPAENQ